MLERSRIVATPARVDAGTPEWRSRRIRDARFVDPRPTHVLIVEAHREVYHVLGRPLEARKYVIDYAPIGHHGDGPVAEADNYRRDGIGILSAALRSARSAVLAAARQFPRVPHSPDAHTAARRLGREP